MSQSSETDPWLHLYGARRRLIACATVIEEILPFLPADVPYEILDFGLHLHPAKLKATLQEKIDEASQLADVLLLGYGLCAMAVVGLKTNTATLVIPRVDDCIALFLGSRAAYRAQAQQEPGTYYLTKGWIEVGDSPFEEYKHLVAKYGEAKAVWMIKLTLENYTRLGFINTGQYDIERYRLYAHRVAEQFDLRYEEIEGSPALVKKMIFGPWDDEFVVIPPGQAVRYEDFVLGS
jgi:hypothetical protein